MTVTTVLNPRRPAESSANPWTLNVPLDGTTMSVSTYSAESASGGVNMSESFGGVVGLVTLPAGEMRKPTFATPEFCTATTSTGIPFPVDPRAPGEGRLSRTRNACTFERKMNSVSAAELLAPSVATPTIMMLPPAPELEPKVIV